MLTPLLEDATACRAARSGRAARSCSTSATSTASTSSTPPIPASGRWSTARCAYLPRDALPAASRGPPIRRSRSRQYAGEVGTSPEADRRDEGEGPGRRRRPRSPSRSTSTARSSSRGRPFIGGDSPSIADIRLAATLEFLHAIDYDFPAWATDYMARVESALGEAYSEPAADVRGYIEYVKSQAAATV